MLPTLSVSIVLHESRLSLLEATLESLLVAVQPLLDIAGSGGDPRVEITLLDNRSSEIYRAQLTERVAALRSTISAQVDFQLQMHSVNAGFGSGHNAALAGSRGRYCLILNPDVELAPDALTEAIGLLDAETQVVALNPRCERDTGDREYLCKRYPTALDLALRGLPLGELRRFFRARLASYEYRDLASIAAQEVELLSGACLLCRRDAFDACGGFDPRYFMYFEDFDLSLRLARLGELRYLPSMRIVHHGGFAARKGRRHIGWFLRSARRFFRTHGWKLR